MQRSQRLLMSFLVLAGLKFSREDIGEVGKNEKDTLPAVIMIFISVLFASVIAFFLGNGGSGGLSEYNLAGFDAAIAGFGSGLIGTFISAIILALVMLLFKVKPTIVGTIRVYGAVIIWSIIGDIVGLILPENLSMLALVFWLLYNIALMIGMTGYTEAKYWQSFLGIVITFAIIFGISMLYGMLIEFIFV